MRAGSGDRAARERDQDVRRRTELAVLQLSGEVGYRGASIAAIVERTGSSRARFYQSYEGKDDCYASAYADVVEDLCSRLLGTCVAAPDWIAGVGRGLGELEAFVAADPALATGLIREVHVAGGPALAKRDQVAGRLADAIDRARRETPPGDVAPPEGASLFVVAAAEATVIRALTDGRPLGEVLGGILFLTVASYLGAAAARRALQDHPGWG